MIDAIIIYAEEYNTNITMVVYRKISNNQRNFKLCGKNLKLRSPCLIGRINIITITPAQVSH